MIVAHGWTILAHPLFLEQLEKLTATVERAEAKDPGGRAAGGNAKLLAALRELVFEKVPSDPSRKEYRQGDTLGPSRKHWFRAKFGNGRYRLFFRYDSASKIVVFAWVNDANSLRARGARTDAYAVFMAMIEEGNPPDNWAGLLKAASDRAASKRLIAAQDN